MSYDIEIISRRRPSEAGIRSSIEELVGGKCEIGGSLTKGGVINVRGHGASHASLSVDIDAPIRCEAEDVSGAAEVVVGEEGGWLTLLSAPIGSSHDARVAIRALAEMLAAFYEGCAYDPQEDRVFFGEPVDSGASVQGGSAGKGRIGAPAQSEEIAFEFCFLHPELASKCRTVVDVLQRSLRAAAPQRYGLYEPLQGSSEDGGFCRLWEDAALEGFGDLLWRGERGCEGEIRFARAGVGPSQGEPADLLALHIRHGTSLESSMAEVFTSIVKATAPFFARVYSQDGLGAPSAVYQNRWYGIPQHPALMMWVSAGLLRRGGLGADKGRLVIGSEGSTGCSEDVPASLWRDMTKRPSGEARESLEYRPIVPAPYLRG